MRDIVERIRQEGQYWIHVFRISMMAVSLEVNMAVWESNPGGGLRIYEDVNGRKAVFVAETSKNTRDRWVHLMFSRGGYSHQALAFGTYPIRDITAAGNAAAPWNHYDLVILDAAYVPFLPNTDPEKASVWASMEETHTLLIQEEEIQFAEREAQINRTRAHEEAKVPSAPAQGGVAFSFKGADTSNVLSKFSEHLDVHLKKAFDQQEEKAEDKKEDHSQIYRERMSAVLKKMSKKTANPKVSLEPARDNKMSTDELLKMGGGISRQHVPSRPKQVPNEDDDSSINEASGMPASGNTPGNYKEQNEVYNDMVDSLGKVEYLHLNTHGTEHQQEVALGEFWCDLVYWNFFDRRAENRIPEAQKRGCPAAVIKYVYERHPEMKTTDATTRVDNLPGEFKEWDGSKQR